MPSQVEHIREAVYRSRLANRLIELLGACPDEVLLAYWQGETDQQLTQRIDSMLLEDPVLRRRLTAIIEGGPEK